MHSYNITLKQDRHIMETDLEILTYTGQLNYHDNN
jgi:hypothetical protein